MAFVLHWSTAELFAALVCAACGGRVDVAGTTGEPLDAATHAAMPDADAAVEQDSGTACDECLYSKPGMPGCGTEMGVCFAEAKCKSLMLCALAGPCFSLADPSARNICMLPCATDAGISSAADPALASAYAVQACAEQQCPACLAR